MTYDPDIHGRRSIRLKNYDYGAVGAYFVTVCVQGRGCLLGDVMDGQVLLNAAGEMVENVWNGLPDHHQVVEIDSHVIMPNHFHGIIWIVGAGPCACPEFKGHPQGGAPTMSLPDVVHRFKSITTARYRHGVIEKYWPPFPGRLWQRNYYERIIRDEDELLRARRYIQENPLKWEKDEENPANTR